MASSFLALGIAQSGLQAAQALMDTAAHNVANDATPGYSRQRADLAAIPGFTTPSFGTPPGPVVGQGVTVQSVQRVRLGYLSGIARQTASDVGLHTTRQDLLTSFQTLFGEPGSNGLDAVMNQFFGAFQTLAQNPSDAGARATVQQDGEALAARLHSIQTGIQGLATQAFQHMGQDVSTVNRDLQSVASLNQAIADAQSVGTQPNDLLDQRSQLLNNLSKIANFTYQTVTKTVGNNTVTQVKISLSGPSGSSVLVEGAKAGSIAASGGASGATLQATDVTGATSTVTPSGGSLAAESTFINYDTNASASGPPPSLANQFQQVVSALTSAVNTQHAKGYYLSSTTGTWQTGEPFFTASGGGAITPSNIEVNPAIQASTQNIAAGATAQSGDGANAQAVADIAQTSGGPLDQYAAFVATMGNQVSLSGDLANTAKALQTQISNQQQSVSGVSVNEEMTNIVRAQAMYNASAKVSATADQMLQSLISSIQP